MCIKPSVYSESSPVARKRHICSECQAPIEVGEKYHRARALWEGEWGEQKSHLLCRELSLSISRNDCIAYGEMKEYYQQIIEPTPEEQEMWGRIKEREKQAMEDR